MKGIGLQVLIILFIQCDRFSSRITDIIPLISISPYYDGTLEVSRNYSRFVSNGTTRFTIFFA